MSNRSGAAGRMGRHSGLGPSALTIFVMIWTGASVDVRADTILLKNGEEIEGSIVDATVNTVIIRRLIGGMRQMRMQDIDEVRIDLAQGEQISGPFLSWVDGVYQLRSGGQVIRISKGVILGPDPRDQAARQAPRGAAPRPEEQPTAGFSAAQVTSPAEEPDLSMTAGLGPEPRDQAARQAPRGAAPRPEEQPTAGLAAAQATSPAEEPDLSMTDGESRTVAVRASVDPAEAGADAMVFRIKLSRPAEQPIVLIYGTLDGSARAGKDYEQQHGVITLAPGAESGEVHVPLIEDQPSKDDKRFELFLIADPEIAEVVQNRISATIHGDD